MTPRHRIALVTGAGSGIGKASSLALSAAGFAVVLAGRRPGPLAAVAGEIEAAGGLALPVAADVADPESVDGLFATLVERFGRLDVLFNNAGRNDGGTPLGQYASTCGIRWSPPTSRGSSSARARRSAS